MKEKKELTGKVISINDDDFYDDPIDTDYKDSVFVIGETGGSKLSLTVEILRNDEIHNLK